MIAVIGLACRFPGARDLGEFWRNLRTGTESITFFGADELRAEGVDPDLMARPGYVAAAPILDDPALFDAAFFGYSPREASVIDPQHRIFLECAWHALEHAGYEPRRVDARAGVYAGAAMNTYLLFTGLAPRLADDYVTTLSGSDKDFLATRVAYKLDLTGPAITVQTACSTSLVAVHLAAQSLLSGECDLALAGGVSVRVPHRAGYLYADGGIVSPDGHCRPFDAEAGGTIFGSGAGVVVLRRLADALASGDTVYAVISGTAVNNDGAAKVNYAAPSVGRQAAVAEEALGNAGVEAETISYVEAHGTGTRIGDPIEIEALTRAHGAARDRRAACLIGSVKSNIGHLDAAAGVAGLIKTLLALRHGQIPATLHFRRPNPEIDFAATPFRVCDRLTPWPAGGDDGAGGPRRAAVNALGVGGTNAHLIVEEAPAQTGPTRAPLPAHPFERQRYWYEATPSATPERTTPPAAPARGAVHAASVRLNGARGPVEAAVIGVWRELLGDIPIGVHDNFYDLGGDSIMVPEVMARLSAVFQHDLPALTVVEAPTPAELADRIEAAFAVEAAP